MPLRVRLGLVFALGAAVLIAAVGVGFVLQLRASLDATIDAGLPGGADAVADEYAADGLRSLRLRRDGEPLQVLTADGRVLASSAALSDAPVLDAAQRAVVIARTGTGHDSLAFTEAVGDRRVRLLATPLPSPGVLLVVGTGTDISDTADDHVERGLLVLAPPAVLVAGLAAWWLAGEALRPVERMRRQIAEISDRNDDSHLAVPRTRDEIAALATTLNDLLDRLRAALANERGFIADAGHELRTPLATLRTELELARRPGRTEAELREAVGAAAVETERVIRLAEDL